MKLTYFRNAVPNFGDELNTYMWPRLLPPGFLDADDNELFLGIGSILHSDYPRKPKKIVFGSGYAGYGDPPKIQDGSWDIVFVRGPLTAETLGLPLSKSICDAAILLRTVDLPPAADPIDVAFIPHFESLERGFWQDACRIAGIRLIDPTNDLETVIAEIRAARIVIAEAMHGAIVADALRTPWIAVRPINPVHHRKWQDWANALSIVLRAHPLRPSSLFELYTKMSGGRGSVPGRAGMLIRSPVFSPANQLLKRLAAARLSKLAEAEPQLSSNALIETATDRASAAIDAFIRTRVAGNVA